VINGGVKGQSVMSTQGVGVLKHVNSAVSSVKMVASSVFMDVPDGYHASVGATAACAGFMVGRWNPEEIEPDIVPGRLARENAIAKRSSSLNVGIFLNFFPETGLGGLSLKDYPRLGFRINLGQDRDIHRIPQHSRCARGCSVHYRASSTGLRRRKRDAPKRTPTSTRIPKPVD